MVVSKLDENIHYKETRDIEESDKQYLATIYEYDILDNDAFYTISLGQENTQYASDNIYFFHVYLVSLDSKKGDRVKSQIGIIEYKSAIQNASKRLKTVSDSEGDVDIEKLNDPIFYGFVTKGFLDKAVPSQKDVELDVEVIEEAPQAPTDADDEDNVFDIPENLPKASAAPTAATTSTKDGIFKIQTAFRAPEKLPEETLEMAKSLKDEFRDSAKTTWIEKFMKNNEYAIVETAANGDCFFDTLVQAFEQIGKQITVSKLRSILAQEVTQDFYETNRTIYVNALAERDAIVADQKKLKAQFQECKKRAKQTTVKSETNKILEDCKRLEEKYENFTKDKRINQEFLQEFDFMEHVDSVEKLKSVIQTTKFWANTWAISTLERILNVKVIVMSKEAFDSGDVNSVLLCGQLNDSVLEQQGYFRPDHYIITEYSGNHYKLISYKQKRIFEFSEIPFYIKTLILNKCLERNAGPYYIIDDIRHFNKKMGAPEQDALAAAASETDDDEQEYSRDTANKHLYDKSAVFMYYSNSNGKPAPGKGNGEMVKQDQLMEFKDLQKVKDWRRMLDDDWPAPFKLDGYTWETVEHYYQAAKYKEQNRDFYVQFTADSGSPFAKDPELAHAAGSKAGTHKDKTTKKTVVFRDKKKIAIDPDFYGTRHFEERRKALYAKFSQNEDLKNVLLNTKRAKLNMYVAKKEPVLDTELMIVRKDLVDGREETK
jgi:predicted NAD-dependent protein-ADP-ribosyltransferase YbiA (DUF1768 family)